MAVDKNVAPEIVAEKERDFQKFIQAKGLKSTKQRSTIVNVFFKMRGTSPSRSCCVV